MVVTPVKTTKTMLIMQTNMISKDPIPKKQCDQSVKGETCITIKMPCTHACCDGKVCLFAS